MRFNFTLLPLFVLLAIFSSSSAAAQSDTILYNVKAGVWSDPTVWSTNTLPTAEDSVSVMYDLRVDVNAFCKYLRTNGHNVIVDPTKTLTISGANPELKDNVHYIDSSKFTLVSSRAELNSGVYKYNFTGAAPNIKATDVIYGITGKGYIRKVNTVNVTGNTLTLGTRQGNMTDMFGNASLNFTIPAGAMNEVSRSTNSTSSNAYTATVTSKTLLTAGPVSVHLDSASLSFDPNFKFNFKFSRNSGLENFQMGCNQATLKGEMKFRIAAQGAITAERTDTLYKASTTKLVWIGQVPVLLVMDLFFMSKVEFSAEAAIQKDLTINANSIIDLGIKYVNGQWQGTSSYTPTAEYKIGETNGSVKAKIALSLKPQFNVRFYDLAGPYIYFDFANSLEGTYSAPSLNWDLLFKTTLEAGVGAEHNFYRDSAVQYGPIKWTKDIFTYRTPFKVVKDTGDQQTFVDTTNYLPIPIRVRVLDTLGKPQRNVSVNFKINKGGGAVRDSVMITDTSGYAETLWKYGSQGFKQELQVFVYRGDSSEIGEEPVYFRSGKDSLNLTLYNQSNTPAFTTNTFKSVGVGKAGSIWAGTQNQGLYTFQNGSWIKNTMLTNHNLNQIQTDKDSTIWIALTGSSTSIGGGIAAIRDSVANTSNWRLYSEVTNNAPNRNARSLWVDTSRNSTSGQPIIWTAHMGNSQTVGDPSGSLGKGFLTVAPYFQRFTTGIQTISQGGTGNCQIVGGDSSEVWAFAATNYGKSQLLRYDTKTGNPKGFHDYTNVDNSILRRAFFANAIYFDNKGKNWVGLDTGIAVRSGGKWTRVWQPFIQFLPTNTFVNKHAITGDSEGNVYIGTNNGFLWYIGGPLNDKSSWEFYTMADKLPSNNILGIKVDEKRARVIFTTDAGIAIWNR